MQHQVTLARRPTKSVTVSPDTGCTWPLNRPISVVFGVKRSDGKHTDKTSLAGIGNISLILSRKLPPEAVEQHGIAAGSQEYFGKHSPPCGASSNQMTIELLSQC